MENNLWFQYLHPVSKSDQQIIHKNVKSVVKSLSDGAAYEFWHHRLGHPGQKIMDKVHSAVEGVPKLKRNKFYSCASCNSAKLRKVHTGPTKKSGPPIASDDDSYEIGQHLHADFGFFSVEKISHIKIKVITSW